MVETTLDGIISIDEENALSQYLDHKCSSTDQKRTNHELFPPLTIIPGSQHPGREGTLLQSQTVPQPRRRVGGDREGRYRPPGSHDQAPVLLGKPEKFRVRYDRIVSFEPYEDGLGIMRDAQTAKPQTFVTGDGWSVYNLAVNLAQV